MGGTHLLDLSDGFCCKREAAAAGIGLIQDWERRNAARIKAGILGGAVDDLPVL